VTLKPASYNEAAPDWTEYDSLIAEIKSNIPADERVAKMHQAEDILMETGAVIPIYYYNDLYLQQTDVEGVYSNLFGFKYFQNVTLPRDVLKINLASEPAKLDPALNSSVDGACIICNTFSGLYAYDENEQLVPACADEANPYEVSEDGLTYTFHLKDGLTWSDGSPLTAGDFEYAWKRAANPETGADYGYLFTDTFAYDGDDIDVKATDDKTLVATLNAPCAYFLDLAAFPAFYPVPQAAVEAADPTGVNPGAWASEAGFLSNGAYTVDGWTHEESLTLKKNPNWYAADTVGVEKIEMMLSADDTAIYAAYNSGDLDFADTVPTNEIEAIKSNDDFHVVDNLGTYYVAFNVNSDLFDGKTVEQAANMRKAFAILIDRDYIIENVGQTEQKCANSFIPAGMADGNGGVFKANTGSYTYPLEDEVGYFPEELQDNAAEEAIALLESAGYVFEDGMLSDETPISVTYLTNEGTGHVAIAEAMQQDLAEIGIDMSIETREWNVFLDERKQGHFDFAREGWLADYNDPINMLEMWASNSGNNDCQFGKSADAVAAETEAAMEEAVEEAVAEATSVAESVAAEVNSAAEAVAAEVSSAAEAVVSEAATAAAEAVSTAAAATAEVASTAAAAATEAVSTTAAATAEAASTAAAAVTSTAAAQ
jgi:peptide/nickel transport system substrate-binding protein/oligopeptide transport system substrate-binding protein